MNKFILVGFIFISINLFGQFVPIPNIDRDIQSQLEIKNIITNSAGGIDKVDKKINSLSNSLDNVAFSGDYKDLVNTPTPTNEVEYTYLANNDNHEFNIDLIPSIDNIVNIVYDNSLNELVTLNLGIISDEIYKSNTKLHIRYTDENNIGLKIVGKFKTKFNSVLSYMDREYVGKLNSKVNTKDYEIINYNDVEPENLIDIEFYTVGSLNYSRTRIY